jgi:hypothetical protein
MAEMPLSTLVKERVDTAARVIGTASPLRYVAGMLDRSFPLPPGDPRYADNALVQDAAPLLPRFDAAEPDVLRFTIEPLGPEAPPIDRRHEATRELRRLAGSLWGNGALRFVDEASEPFRGTGSFSQLNYGAWFTSAYDDEGLRTSTVIYELGPRQLEALPPRLAAIVRAATETIPTLVPVYTSVTAARDAGAQRITFMHRGPLRLRDLEPLLSRLGLAHQLPGVMQIVGLTLGGRFELPDRTVLIAIGDTAEGPELRIDVLLGNVPDVPTSFLDLVALGLSEKPRELRALARFLRAFTPEAADGPGDLSVMTIRTTPVSPPKVALYLRPLEFEVAAGRNAEEPQMVMTAA